jgi:hypothetical protein
MVQLFYAIKHQEEQSNRLGANLYWVVMTFAQAVRKIVWQVISLNMVINNLVATIWRWLKMTLGALCAACARLTSGPLPNNATYHDCWG